MAERLRRRPAKPMGSPRVGSNPTGVAYRTKPVADCWLSAGGRQKKPVATRFRPVATGCHRWPPAATGNIFDLCACGQRSFATIRRRDSSVGRASDRRSEGPRFDPGSRQGAFKALVSRLRRDFTAWPWCAQRAARCRVERRITSPAAAAMHASRDLRVAFPREVHVTRSPFVA